MSRTLKKALGQHFLIRTETCEPLVSFLEPDGCRVLEIGPGSGTLTRALLDAGARVTAWEVDPHWGVEIAARWPDRDLQVVVGDATRIEWRRVPFTLVAGNLPYNVATRIVLRCLRASVDADSRLQRAAFLVQSEVAERLAAGPDAGAYGSLSVLAGALARVELLGRVAPGAFHPPPKVESAFVGLTPHRRVGRKEYERLEPLVRAAFAYRRKTLRNSLARQFGSAVASELIETCGLPAGIRAEQLDLAAFQTLARCLPELPAGAAERDRSGRASAVE